MALKQNGEMERKGLGGKKVRKPLFPDLSSYWSRHTWATMAVRISLWLTISLGVVSFHSINSSICRAFFLFTSVVIYITEFGFYKNKIYRTVHYYRQVTFCYIIGCTISILSPRASIMRKNRPTPGSITPFSILDI